MSSEAVERTTGQYKTHLIKDVHYKVNIPDRKDWEVIFRPKHGIIRFNNGSNTKNGDGAGCCDQRSEDTPKIVAVIRATLRRIARGNTFNPVWIPSDTGWEGNERTDKLAKQTTKRIGSQ